MSCTVSVSLAGPDERAQAFRIHNRLAGVPPSESILNSMEADIIDGDELDAARTAMTNKHFYTVTLKNFAAPWTNREQSVFVPLNDYTALVIGMVKDSGTVPFTDILSADLLYVRAGAGLPSANSNAYYEALEQAMLAPTFNPQTPRRKRSSSPARTARCSASRS
jgi:hypothetical protein